MSEYKICSKGVWDSTIPNITFDEQGVSNFCKLQMQMMSEYPRGEKGLSDWETLVDKIKQKGKNRNYDCIIGVSGGVDSSYLLVLAKKNGLRPLAVNLDNGFNSDIAVQNIFKITSALNIDLETYVIDYEEIKDLLRAYMRAGIAWADTPTDLAIKAVMYKIALQEKINYIIRGNDFRSEGKQPKEWTYADDKQLMAIHKQFGSGIKLKTYPRLPFYKIIYAGLIKRIQDVRPFYYLEYKKQDAKQLLIKEYGWQDYGGHHHENIFTKFCMSYWLPKKFQIDKRKINLSAQVLSNAISREEALKKLQEPFDNEKKQTELVAYVKKKLDISDSEYEQIWNSPNKNVFDYPSDYKMMHQMLKYLKPVISIIYNFKPMSISEQEIIGDKKNK